jgi:iduronate 2-sulfatase
MYPTESMPVVTGLEADLQDIPEAALQSQVKAQLSMTDLQKRQARQAYQACISFMDAQVGKVLDALDRHGLTDSTVIVFTSDHGYHLGEHSLWQKRSLFEESARVPLLIAAPGCQQGQVCSAPVSHVDLYPTLTELCGVTAPAGLQGQSLVPMLRDVTQPGRNWALTQVQRGNAGTNSSGKQSQTDTRYFGYSLRTPRWRYTEWDDGSKGRELYDHDNDPQELTNLADQQQHSETLAQLSALLKTAVAGTLPADGKIPEVQPGLWAPVLLDP